MILKADRGVLQVVFQNYMGNITHSPNSLINKAL